MSADLAAIGSPQAYREKVETRIHRRAIPDNRLAHRAVGHEFETTLTKACKHDMAINDDHSKLIFRYWGKADPSYPAEPKWHPLVYHCLDVAACGAQLLERRPVWLDNLGRISGLPSDVLRPWLLFLFAIHDIGKFADGFQNKRPDLLEQLQGRKDVKVGGNERHDTLGYVLAEKHLLDWLGQDGGDKYMKEDMGSLLKPWLAAVTGHHGRPPKNDGARALMLRNHFPAPVLSDAREFVADAGDFFLRGAFLLSAPEPGLEERYQRASCSSRARSASACSLNRGLRPPAWGFGSRVPLQFFSEGLTHREGGLPPRRSAHPHRRQRCAPAGPSNRLWP